MVANVCFLDLCALFDLIEGEVLVFDLDHPTHAVREVDVQTITAGLDEWKGVKFGWDRIAAWLYSQKRDLPGKGVRRRMLRSAAIVLRDG